MDESTAIREERVKMRVARAEFHCQTRSCKSDVRRLHWSPGPHAKAVGFFLSDHLRNPYTHFLSKIQVSFKLSKAQHYRGCRDWHKVCTLDDLLQLRLSKQEDH